MPSYAVTLAGIPASTNAGVLQDLRDRFSDGYVFRAPAARATDAGRLTNYSENGADLILEAARDTIFGSTKRPNGFCRNPTHSCVLLGGGKKNCNKGEGDRCYLSKPDFLIIIFQGGKNEELLLHKLHFCAFIARIPEDCYGRRARTLQFVISTLSESKHRLSLLREELSSKFSPMLLPPNNFRGEKIRTLLSSACNGDFSNAVKAFRSEFFRKDVLSYMARKRQLAFKPAEPHGNVGPQERADLALSRHHRLGCTYLRGLHFDVTRANGRNFDGTTEFCCRSGGVQRPHGKYVNILVDDCFR